MGTGCVITGMGVISPSGVSLDAYRDNLWAGRVAVAPTDFVIDGRSYPSWTGRVSGFDPTLTIDPKVIDGTDTGQQYAIAAADAARRDAGLDELDPRRTAIVTGTGVGGVVSLQHAQYLLDHRGFDAVPAKTMIRIFGNMAAAQLAMRWDLHGPQITLCHACATGIDVVGTAADLIRRGRVDLAIAVSYEAPLAFGRPDVDEHFVPGQLAAGLHHDLTPDAPAARPWPFDKHRTGSAAADGAACVIVEAATHATARSQRVWATVDGYASLGEGHHPSSPDPTGRWERAAMADALAHAGVPVDEVDAIVAHGTATRKGDAAEIAAINDLFGHRPRPIPATSIKGHMGHCGAASGTLSIVAAALALQQSSLVHTAGTTDVEDSARFDLVTRGPRPLELRRVLVNAFGFGGQDASILLGRG